MKTMNSKHQGRTCPAAYTSLPQVTSFLVGLEPCAAGKLISTAQTAEELNIEFHVKEPFIRHADRTHCPTIAKDITDLLLIS